MGNKVSAAMAVALVTADLQALVERTIDGLGFELVDLERAAGGVLRVTLDAPTSPHGPSAADCERVSRHLIHLFAVEDVDYQRLEVSSPGVDRPLKRARDFVRFAGAEIAVQLFAPPPGMQRKRLRGRVAEVCGASGAERIRLAVTNEQASAPRRPGDGKRMEGKRVHGSSGNASRGERNGAAPPAATGSIVEFALADVERARLVPKLDFRSGRS